MIKMLETQVGQLAGRLTNDEGKLSGQPKGPESAKAIQTHSGKETEDLERSTGARKPKPSTEGKEIAKEKVTGIVTKEPEFEMLGEDTRIPQLKPRYFRGNLDNHFEKFVEVGVDLVSTCHYWMPFKYLNILVTLKTYLQINMT
jgi:hypothetical protein